MTGVPVSERISVLFVDDEPSILRALERTLRDTQLEVLTAPDGPTALALLATRRVDVLVSDIDMHGMNGLELIALARRRHPNMLRMLLSGQSTLTRALQAINEGEVVRFFSKPFEPYVFRDTIESLANRIAQLRRDGEESARAVRRTEMYAWMDERFPGATTVATNEAGDVLVDVPKLFATIEASGSTDLLRLLRRGSKTP